MRYSLEANRMYALLCGKTNCLSLEEYKGILNLIEQQVSRVLGHIPSVFPGFTDHGIDHSFRILNYLFEIMSQKLRDELSGTEVFCLIMSALFHDMGMGNPDEPDVNKLRDEHHRYASEPLRKFLEKLQLHPYINRLEKCIDYTCLSHMKTIQELYSEQLISRCDTIQGDTLRYGLLAILLRIGDLMDMEEERTSYMVANVYPSYYADYISSHHHDRHTEIDSYCYGPEEIQVLIKSKNRVNHKIWSGWLSYLEQEILNANTKYMPRHTDSLTLPALNYAIEPVKGANYCTEEIRFELDDKGSLWKILSQSVYTGEYDFLRELVQNSIDACLIDAYLNPELPLPRLSPREWDVKKYQITVLFSEAEKLLLVWDNGIGMSESGLKNYLFKTADSGYKYINSERDFPFPAIAKFGIGFVACLTKADAIHIDTQKADRSCPPRSKKTAAWHLSKKRQKAR